LNGLERSRSKKTYFLFQNRIAQPRLEKEAAARASAEAKERAKAQAQAEREARAAARGQPRSSQRREKSVVEQITGSSAFKQFARTAGTQIVRSIFGTARRRR